MSLFTGIEQVIGSFQKYATTDAEHRTISKAELALMLRDELGECLGVRNLSCLLI